MFRLLEREVCCVPLIVHLIIPDIISTLFRAASKKSRKSLSARDGVRKRKGGDVSKVSPGVSAPLCFALTLFRAFSSALGGFGGPQVLHMAQREGQGEEEEQAEVKGSLLGELLSIMKGNRKPSRRRHRCNRLSGSRSLPMSVLQFWRAPLLSSTSAHLSMARARCVPETSAELRETNHITFSPCSLGPS